MGSVSETLPDLQYTVCSLSIAFKIICQSKQPRIWLLENFFYANFTALFNISQGSLHKMISSYVSGLHSLKKTVYKGAVGKGCLGGLFVASTGDGDDDMIGIFTSKIQHLRSLVRQLSLCLSTRHQWCKHSVHLPLFSQSPTICRVQQLDLGCCGGDRSL